MATVLGTVGLSGCNYQLAYDLLGQNIANNTSTVRFYGILNVTNNYVSWTRGTASVHTSSGGIGTSYSKGSHTLITADFTFSHNADGTFSAYIGASLSTTFVSGNTGGTLTLPTIPRQANITGANNFTDEDNPIFTFSNPGGFPMNVWLEPNPNGDHLCTRNNIPNTGRYTWSLTDDERNQLRAKCSSNSCTVRIGLYTIIGNTTYASYVDKTMTIINGTPTFNYFTYQDINQALVELTVNYQILVNGLSILQTIISQDNKMIANKQATPKNYVATIDDINNTSIYSDEEDVIINLGNISSIGTKRLNVRAYDSRNNSTLICKDIEVYEYDKPVIYATVTRLNNWENETTLKVNGNYSKLTINDVDKNIVISLQYRYRETGMTWSEWKNLTGTIENGSFTCEDVIFSLDNTKSFEFEIQVIDRLQANNLLLTLDVGEAIFFISSNKKTCYINGQEILTYDIVDEW